MPVSSTVRIGAHVDQDDPLAGAAARTADVAQFFLGDPQGWKGPRVAFAGGAPALRAAAGQADVTLYVHGPYIINVASTNNRIRIPSRKLLQQQATAAGDIGAAGLIVHGGHVLAGDDPTAGFDNWRKAIERLESNLPVLIENTAGGANAMARSFDRLAQLWETAAGANPDVEVGFCLDTCHAHAAGEVLADVVERALAITGRIDLLHCNDSRDEFGSGADRHANLGAGHIAADDLVTVAKQAAAAGAAIIVETPGDVEGQAADITWLRERLD